MDKKLKRRDFLKSAIAAVGGASLAVKKAQGVIEEVVPIESRTDEITIEDDDFIRFGDSTDFNICWDSNSLDNSLKEIYLPTIQNMVYQNGFLVKDNET